MQRYDKYKNSGIEWLGDIPQEWEVNKLKYLTTYFKGFAFKSSSFKEAGIPIIKASNLKDHSVVDIKNYIAIDDQQEAFENVRLKLGDILISTVGSKPEVINSAVGQLASVDESFIDAYLNQNTVCIRPTHSIKYNFLKYVFISRYMRSNFDAKALWIANQAYLEVERIRDNPIVFPDMDEQTAIANYLDQKTAEIDNLIKQKQQLITLYQEEKAALINQAVTKGLNPNVKMKDSGVEWLGEIPDSWKIKRLRYAGNCKNGVSAGAEFFGSGHPFVNYTDVYKSNILPHKVAGLALSTESDRKLYSIEYGDVLFTRTSETVEEIGLASTCLKTIKDSIFAGFLIRFRPYPELLNPEFSKYYFSCSLHRRFFVKEMNLVTRASLSQELLKRMPVVIPTSLEQREIADFLDKSTLEIEFKIIKTKRIIELQQEYRTALISEAVTGKFKVPELVEKEFS